jgi:hypothetical protein
MKPHWLLSGYSKEIVRYLFFASISLGCWWMVTDGAWGGWKAYAGTWMSAVGLGIYWHLVSFTAHDIVRLSILFSDSTVQGSS